MAAKNSFSPGASSENLALWQQKTRVFLQEVLYNGGAPEAVPLDPWFGKTEVREGYKLIEIKFASSSTRLQNRKLNLYLLKHMKL